MHTEKQDVWLERLMLESNDRRHERVVPSIHFEIDRTLLTPRLRV
ncbi:hypothetical protein AVEN_67644-1, partial [Araneus ventricosus]